tara:strand:+ start:296 stop:751 length:456 start_codon:yes stop_codon:yes gene_type:complete
MELWQLNIIAVVLIAVVTRKDMAVVAGVIMVAGYYVTLGDYLQAEASLYFCALNCLLAVIAAAYNHIKHCNLSIFTACVAALATVVDLYQAYDQTAFSSTISSIMGWSLVLALIFMDGDKGIVSGFIRDFRASFGQFIRMPRRVSNNKSAD